MHIGQKPVYDETQFNDHKYNPAKKKGKK